MSVTSFKDARVLISGACGTVGSELTRQVVEAGAKQVICIDNNETELFFLQQQWKEAPAVCCYLADIRDLRALSARMQNIDVVLHSAALKHVGLCEESPTQAVQTNIDGTQNIIEAALLNNVKRVVFTSSDKAVNPTNVMGTSKLMGERLMTAADESNKDSNTIFASTRFGNVLGSRGSVIPLFQKQIFNGGPLTLTDKNMTRFIMTLEEAAALVLKSVWMATGGEVFVTKMPVARIEDLALCVKDALDTTGKVKIIEIGAKPGEKVYEELMNDEEIRRTFEHGDFFVVLSAFADHTDEKYSQYIKCSRPVHPYNSANEVPLSKEELAIYLDERRVLV